MRLLVVIPHYFGPSHPENNLPAISSYIEPLGRIAALNEMIVALHGQFGRYRFTSEGKRIVGSEVDIIIMTQRDRNILSQLGLDRGTYEVEYVDDKAPYIGFRAHPLLRDRLGSYDFYCYMEDDLIIRDPAFFEKLLWFQRSFGPKTVLAPVRYELAATGTPAKVAVDVGLADKWSVPFRRPEQRPELEGIWAGRKQTFRIPNNAHSGCFFLTQEQMAYWVKQPSFNDRDASWIGPLESAGTLSVGKVFDIYKPDLPDSLFLEIHHFGVRYAAQATPPGMRWGEPPLLAIAQNAMRAGINPASAAESGSAEQSLARLVEESIARGTAVEHRAKLDGLENKIQLQQQRIAALTAEINRLRAQSGPLQGP